MLRLVRISGCIKNMTTMAAIDSEQTTVLNMSFDISGFNDFFAEYHRRFTRFAYSYVRDSAIAEDLVMESTMAFWSKRDSLPSDTNIAAFVLTVLKNKCLDYLRHLKVTQTTASYSQLQLWDIETRYHNLESFDPEEVFKKEIMEIVSGTLSSLPQKTKDIFVMSRFEDKKYREIGVTCKLPWHNLT